MNLDMALTHLSHDPHAPLDLAELALTLARDEYPALDVEAYLSELDGMAREARARMRGPLAARVAGLCICLFHDLGFRGNRQDYYDPRNSYLSDVLDRRTGIPIALSAVTMAVAGRAGLEVVGVGLPGHFVVKAVSGGEEFLFDPFHGGRPLSPEQCEALVEQVTGHPFEVTPQALEAVPLGLIVQRMLTNLKVVYLGQDDFGRAARVIGRLLQLHPEDALQRRDLGVCLLRSGQPGRAIGPLQTYLNALPAASDADVVRQMLQQAQGSIARWN